MRFTMPKPLHGWREFGGEIAIIVIGVLLALGAEQMVQGLHSKAAVAEFTFAADRELEYDLAVFKFRIDQLACIEICLLAYDNCQIARPSV